MGMIGERKPKPNPEPNREKLCELLLTGDQLGDRLGEEFAGPETGVPLGDNANFCTPAFGIWPDRAGLGNIFGFAVGEASLSMLSRFASRPAIK